MTPQADLSRLNDLLRMQHSQQGYPQQDSGQSRPSLQQQHQQQQSHQQPLQHPGATDRTPQALASMSPASGAYQVYTSAASGQINNATPLPQPRPLGPMAERSFQGTTTTTTTTTNTSTSHPHSFRQDSNQADATSPQQQPQTLTTLPSQRRTGAMQPASPFLPNPILQHEFQLSALNQVPRSVLNTAAGVPQNPTVFNSHMLNSANYSFAMNGAMYPPGSAAALLPNPMREPASIMGSSNHLIAGKKPITLYMPCDDESLSAYQCLVRKNIELFEADKDELDGNAKGRNKPIVLGQVGIRCKHCSMMPSKNKGRGSKYYPAKLSGIYQAAQSMASGHLCNHCNQIPHTLRNELMILREKKSSAGGGKKYWADGVRVLGVVEDEQALRFKQKGQD
ncbi:MAG: hypothetical protein SGBAC_009512 [Bacillariaceae sp.]